MKRQSNPITRRTRCGLKTTLLFALLSLYGGRTNAQNNALDFTGVCDVELLYKPQLDFQQTDKFTLEGWFKTTNITSVIYSNKVDVSPFTGYEVAIVGSKFVFEITNDYISSALRVETGSAYNDGTWHHFAVVYKGIPNANNVQVYMDGVLQPMVISTNNLSSSPQTSNSPHIGNRDGSAYFFSGQLDELRIWGKALCSAEITGRMNCELTGKELDLLAYYNFNQGIPGGSNTGITALTDNSGNNVTGMFNNFNLSGTNSNFVASTANVSGTCNYKSPVVISGSGTVCAGSTKILTASGATSYTWSTNANTSTISVTPSNTTTYSVRGTNTVTGCSDIGTFTIQTVICTGLQENSGSGSLEVYPNPSSGIFLFKAQQIDMNISLYNAEGRLIYTAQNQGVQHQIDLSDHASGIYFLRCSGAGEIRTIRLIRE
jgi:hypothetical protein